MSDHGYFRKSHRQIIDIDHFNGRSYPCQPEKHLTNGTGYEIRHSPRESLRQNTRETISKTWCVIYHCEDVLLRWNISSTIWTIRRWYPGKSSAQSQSTNLIRKPWLKSAVFLSIIIRSDRTYSNITGAREFLRAQFLLRSSPDRGIIIDCNDKQ
jgi:hypothetical protein